MKIIVIDLDRCKFLSLKDRIKLNSNKICTITARDFGKKTLLSLPNNDPECLRATKNYEKAIFTIKDDERALKHENKLFRDIQKRIKWFRVGVILRREKAVKILLKLLKR